MTAKEWERIKALFDAALAISAEKRLSWLEEACAETPELYATVAQLLRNYDEGSLANLQTFDAGPLFSAGELVAGRFQILRLIARGGMGEVYEAIDNKLHGLRVALKTLRLGLATERQAHDRFKREVWVIREIPHEGLCQMFDLVEHRSVNPDGTEVVVPCLTMQLLEGESLKDFLGRHRPLGAAEALPLLRQVAHALQAMHDKAIVHRDLKPSNIMLVPRKDSTGMRVILIDFGLAKRLTAAAVWETRTEQGQAGAPYFIAPEVLNGEKGGIPADVYAFGLLIDEMVTCSPAFPSKSVEELYWRKLRKPPVLPSARSDHLPPHWETAILSCLHPDPARRSSSVLAVLDAIESPSSFGESTTRSQLKASLRRVVQRTHVSRRVWIGMAAGAAAASAVSAVGIFATPEPPFTSSILIFPFQNLTKTPEYNHICIGTVDELMRRLTYLPGLSVYPVPKSWTPDPSAIKKARFSLKGSLQQFADKVRLSVRLTENDGGAVVWTETFDRTLTDPLALESEIAERTVDGMRRRVAESSSLLSRIRIASAASFGRPLRRVLGTDLMLPSQATRDNVAFDEYQRGRELCQTRTLPAALEAMNRFQKAIDSDPTFALAYAALADVHPILLNYNYAPTLQLLSDALRYSEKGVELDQSLPECHTARAAARQNLWDWEESHSSYRVAIEKNPKFARAYHWYAGLIHQFGRFDEALDRARKGLELDPFDYPAQSNYGLYLWNAGRLKDAAAQLESVLEKSDLVYAHNVLGQVYAALAASSPKGEATEYFVRSLGEAATVHLRDIEAAGGSDPGYLKWSDLIFTQAHAARGDHASAEHFVRRLERGLQAGKISASALAWAHAAVGNRNRTLDLLEYGLEQREREMLNIRVIPLFQFLHGDHRFDRILQRMKLA